VTSALGLLGYKSNVKFLSGVSKLLGPRWGSQIGSSCEYCSGDNLHWFSSAAIEESQNNCKRVSFPIPSSSRSETAKQMSVVCYKHGVILAAYPVFCPASIIIDQDSMEWEVVLSLTDGVSDISCHLYGGWSGL
jgi:hypothetical protein